jgi:hypothetical protein
MTDAEVIEEHCAQRALVGGIERTAGPGRPIVVDLAGFRFKKRCADLERRINKAKFEQGYH